MSEDRREYAAHALDELLVRPAATCAIDDDNEQAVTLGDELTGMTREGERPTRVTAEVSTEVRRRGLGVRIPFSGPLMSDVVRIEGWRVCGGQPSAEVGRNSSMRLPAGSATRIWSPPTSAVKGLRNDETPAARRLGR